MKKIVLVLSIFLWGAIAFAQEYKEVSDITYYSEKNAPERGKERCKLDVYYPTDGQKLPTIIWFHGGGLTAGSKEIPADLKNKDLIVVGAGYRLAPDTEVKDIIKDAAQAVKWVYKNIETYGGDPQKIIISGHSAGGYLALMLGLNKEYLEEVGIDNQNLLGIVPFSPQTITHFTERKSRDISELRPIIDSLAPLYWVTKEAPPVSLITGDREMEMLGRYEENAYLARMLKLSEHPYVKLFELQGYSHDMTYPAFPILLREVKNMMEYQEKDQR